MDIQNKRTKLVKKIKIETTLTLKTGLHIGGSKENVEIGGIDLPVIKLPMKNNQPYIPGSSLKGKMRCLLEQTFGATEVGGNSKVNDLFGITANKNIPHTIPSRLIVRDSMLTEDTVKEMDRCSDTLDLPFTENKYENTINRVEGKAEHPRQLERVPAGAKFHVEFIINVWNTDNADDLLALLEKGIGLLQNDYLGGSGSRGYGQVEFGERQKTEISEENNWEV